MADGRPKENTLDRNAGASGSTPQDSAEAKRLEARRRFLLGGAAAIPTLVTVNRAKAQMLTLSQCVAEFPNDLVSNDGDLKELFMGASVISFGDCKDEAD